jgi:D-cysteine desulfhydrase
VLDCPAQLSNVELCVHDGFLGAGYGVPSLQGRSAIAATARAEGVFLDPTYTGKAMAGYSALLSQGRYASANDVLFLHTGGAPSLFTAAVEGMS